jgi:hypothetical protein
VKWAANEFLQRQGEPQDNAIAGAQAAIAGQNI